MNKKSTNELQQTVKVMIDGAIKTFIISDVQDCNSMVISCISWDTPIARAISDLEIGEASNVALSDDKVSRIILLERF